ANFTFVEQFKNSRDFYLISSIANSGQPNYEKSGIAWAIIVSMVLVVALDVLSMFQASFLAAGIMPITGCCRAKEARDSIDWTVLLVIAATLGLGNAMQVTGAAQIIASSLLNFAQSSPYLALSGIYIATWIMTETITNSAAAALVFPVAVSIAA